MKKMLWGAAIAWGLCSITPVWADDLVVTINLVNEQGVGKSIGTIMISEGPNGLLFAPKLSGLTPGLHAFHIHQNPSCAAGEKDGKPVPGLAAGGHYDPAGAGKHEGHAGHGHLGDLPVLKVGADGTASTAVTAPRLKLSDVKNRSIMIHAGGDTYSDTPAALGGGGPRIACGVIR